MTKIEKTYALVALIGLIVTWYCNIQFMIEHGGFSVALYISENYVNYGSASIANDIIVVVIAFFIWSFREAKRLEMKHWWLYCIGTFGIAIAFTMPLFLMMRERRLRQLNGA